MNTGLHKFTPLVPISLFPKQSFNRKMEALKKDRNMKQTWMAAVEKERKKRPLPIKYIPSKSDMKYFNIKIYKDKINHPRTSPHSLQPIKWNIHIGYEYNIHSSIIIPLSPSKCSSSQPHLCPSSTNPQLPFCL